MPPTGASTALHVFPSTDALAEALEAYVAKLSAEAVARHGSFTVALSGGSLPKLLGAALRRRTRPVQYDAWHVFFADERCVPLDAEDCNFRACVAEVLDPLGVPRAQVYPLDARLAAAAAAEECAADYMEKLKNVFARKNSVKFPVFDLIALGVGPDGHTASLFPGHELLREDLEWVAHLTDSPKPPPARVTLTLPVLNHAHNVAFVATGDGKQQILRRIIDERDQSIPSTLVQPNGRLTWFLDEPAAKMLKAQTEPFDLDDAGPPSAGGTAAVDTTPKSQ